MWNASLDASQARIKISRRNINNLRRWYKTNGKSKEELKSLWIRVKEESEKIGLKLKIQKTKITVSSSISSVQLLSHVQLFATPMDCSMPGFPVHHLSALHGKYEEKK